MSRLHRLKDKTMKDATGLGVQLSQIYFPKYCLHHPNGAP